MSAGKSTLAQQLVERFGLRHLKTQDFIRDASPRVQEERGSLQRAGHRLDRATDGAWVAAALSRWAGEREDEPIVVIDSVRTEGQIAACRASFGTRVTHMHLTAPPEVLDSRYVGRQGSIQEFGSYAEVRRDRTERDVDNLRRIADVVIDTQRCSQADVLARAASHLGFFGKLQDRLVDVLVGGAYGSEGKGQVAAYLSREYDLLVRVGGPNAGHKVFERPTPFTHHQLPSGTRTSEADLLIPPGAVIEPTSLIEEINTCDVSVERLAIDPKAMIIEPNDAKFEEGTLKAWIASTAQGVGAASARRIMRGALLPGLKRATSLAKVKLARDVPALNPWVRDTLEILDDAYYAGRRVLIEGTQGVGLSIYHGLYPHVTSRDTTVAGCLSEAGVSPSRVRRVVMVCRCMPIRVQDPDTEGMTSGFISQELDWEEVAERSGKDAAELRALERTSTTDRQRRVGEFDWSLLRRASSLNGPTDIALTFVDYLARSNENARRYEQLEPDTINFIEEVERVAGAPVSLISTRFHYRSIIDRRIW